MSCGNEGFERDDLAAFLEIKEVARETVIELRSKSLIVHQDYVGLLKGSVYSSVFQEIAALQVNVTTCNAPEPTTSLKFLFLKFRQDAGILHDLAAPAFASNLKRRL